MNITADIAEKFLVLAELEQRSSLSYCEVAYFFGSKSYDGFREFYQKKSLECQCRAMKYYDYVQDRGGDVQMREVALNRDLKLPETLLDGVKRAFFIQEKLSVAISDLVNYCRDNKDQSAVAFLLEFVRVLTDIQIEADRLAKRISDCQQDRAVLHVMDCEMNKK